jgi:preprotein translocase subunit YajC
MTDAITLTLTLAQDGAAPPIQENAAAPGGSGTTAPGTPPGGGAAPGPMGGPDFIWIMLVAVGAMILFSILGQRKERKKREALINAVKKHDRVQTIGGIIGSIVEVKPNTVVLKVDESSNTRITFSRSAIQQVLDASPDAATPAAAS